MNTFFAKAAAFCTLAAGSIASVHAQCPVTATVDQPVLYCGDEARLSAVPQGEVLFHDGFNSGSLNSVWLSSSPGVFTNPCGPGDGSPYLLLGSSGTGPRYLATQPFAISAGAVLSFDMRYAIQGGFSPCEGPDQFDEGVSIQYSVDNGGTWITLEYYDPFGGNDLMRTSWTTYQVNMPLAACTPATQLRWFQAGFSDSGLDTWALDNVWVKAPAVGPHIFEWQHTGIPSTSPDTPPVSPVTSTTYTVVYTDNTGSTCSSSVGVAVRLPAVSATATPSHICTATSSQLLATTDLKGRCLPDGSNAVTVTAGNGTLVHPYNSNGVSTFGDFGDAAASTQLLFRASELNAAGLYAGQIRSLAFDIAALEGPSAYPSFSIQAAGTTANALGNTFLTGLSTVLSPRTVQVKTGWNVFTFDNSFYWDGTSNLVFQICWYQANGSRPELSAKTKDHTTSFRSAIQSAYNISEGECITDKFISSANRRPNTRIEGCTDYSGPIVYQWSPAANLSSSSVPNPVATPSGTATYTVTVYESGKSACANTASVVVMVSDTAPVTPPTAVGDAVCIARRATLRATSPAGPFTWYAEPSGGSPLATGPVYTTPPLLTTTTYYVETASGICKSPRTPVVATVSLCAMRTASPGDAGDKGYSVTVSPNPFKDGARITVSGVEGEIQVQITDMLGREVRSLKGFAGTAILLERGNLESGIYLCRITGAGITAPLTKLIIE
jgi:hypothetical protein